MQATTITAVSGRIQHFEEEVGYAKLTDWLSHTHGVTELVAKLSTQVATRSTYIVSVNTDAGYPVVVIGNVTDTYGRDLLMRRIVDFNDTDEPIYVTETADTEVTLRFSARCFWRPRSLELMSPTELLAAAKKSLKEFNTQLNVNTRLRKQLDDAIGRTGELESQLAIAKGLPDPYAPNEEGLYPDEE